MTGSSTYRLTENIRSSVKSAVLYGNKGDIVKIIADHIEVLICENECGRFPVLKIHVTDGPVSLDDEPAFIPQKVPSKKQPTKKPFQSPSTLF